VRWTGEANLQLLPGYLAHRAGRVVGPLPCPLDKPGNCHGGHELLTFILAPTSPTSLRLRRSVK